MKKISDWLRSSGFLVLLTLLFYVAGVFCMKTPNVEELRQSGVATQEEYTYVDSEGEEHEGETLIDITGIGRVLTYKDVYLALIIGAFLFTKEGDIVNSGELRHVVFANCIIGVFIIWLTPKTNILSTILYWLGIVSSYLAIKKNYGGS